MHSQSLSLIFPPLFGIWRNRCSHGSRLLNICYQLAQLNLCLPEVEPSQRGGPSIEYELPDSTPNFVSTISPRNSMLLLELPANVVLELGVEDPAPGFQAARDLLDLRLCRRHGLFLRRSLLSWNHLSV